MIARPARSLRPVRRRRVAPRRSPARAGHTDHTGHRGHTNQAGQAGQGGQAAVELALVLPLVAILLLLLLQVGLVVRDQILVVHAAREGAREAAVDPAPDAARAAAASASGLDRGRLQVDVAGRGGAGSRVRVTARYRSPTAVPIVGAVVQDLTLQASATMRVER